MANSTKNNSIFKNISDSEFINTVLFLFKLIILS